MFKTILVPTDGSDLSEKAIQGAIELARQGDGKIVALSVAEPYPYSALSESAVAAEQSFYEQQTRTLAQAHVDKVAEAAAAAGVPCEKAISFSFSPYEEILKTAEGHKCDLIVMASHGRRGLHRLLIGSETQKVLSHTRLPVLVYR